MNKEMKIVREVNAIAEALYGEAEKLGKHAALALGKGRRAQMTGLENIAESALKTSDIFDYIKKQTARFEYWSKGDPKYEKPNEAFGLRLKNFLENEIRERRNYICDNRLGIGNRTEDEKRERQRIYRLLIRQFIRQMVVHYEFSVSVDEVMGNGTQR